MLSTLPELLFLAPFSALLIRVALALTFTFATLRHTRGSERVLWLALIEIAAAITLALGVRTQIAAIAGAAIICVWLISPRMRPLAHSTALLALVLSLSLIVTGAGAFAFDLPL